MGSDEVPPLRETLAELQACGETFLVARDPSGALAGAISWRVDGPVIDLHRLVVDPAGRRVGARASGVGFRAGRRARGRPDRGGERSRDRPLPARGVPAFG